MTGRRVRLFGRRAADHAGRETAETAHRNNAERSVAAAAAPPVALTIDALGRKCPIPIIMLAEQIKDVPLGAVVAVLADDPAAYTDVPAWCAMKAQEFVQSQELPRGGWAIYIRRAV
jgi:tRNA 2-thiouridine synthesizing protein A